MLTNSVSIYKRISDIKSEETIPLDLFLENIRSGKWEDLVHPIRCETNKEERTKMKEKVPYVTLSGKFATRFDDKLEKHSGYIGIDIDNLDEPQVLKDKLINDPHVVAAFITISGRGLCLVFRIEPGKHREAFQGICEYLMVTYKVVTDPTSINVSRPRYVSYDPHLYLNERATKFTIYPTTKPPKKIEKVVFDKTDFEQVIKQIVERRLNLAENYNDWLRLGFAICSKFGEQGREYFHLVSQYSSKYDSRINDKQFDIMVKRRGTWSGSETNISTFYYYARQAGLEIYSQRTKLIAYSAAQGKKSGLTVEQVAENLEKFEGITEAKETIQQVMDDGIELNEDTLLDQLELFIRQNYNLRRNEITRYIENNAAPMQQKDFNTVFVRAKKVFDKLSYEMLDRLINSDMVPTFNPLKMWFEQFSDLDTLPVNLDEGEHLSSSAIVTLLETHFPLITRIFKSIETRDADYLLYFGAKWLAGVISALNGEHSSLMLVLSGEKQNTGKSEWFRRLLPKDLKPYYAESKLDAGKDDEILMTQKAIIMDDEMGGKSKREVKRLKELTSKAWFSLREPYGRNNVDLKRIAVLAGTTNDNEILSDPTGNRRIIPIHVESINHNDYNAIDKTLLWREVFILWKCGMRWRLTKEDIDYLNTQGFEFEMSVAESELVLEFFAPGEDEWLSATEIKVIIEAKTNQRLSLDRISKDLKRLGFAQKHVRACNSTRRVYNVSRLKGSTFTGLQHPAHEPDDLPF